MNHLSSQFGKLCLVVHDGIQINELVTQMLLNIITPWRQRLIGHRRQLTDHLFSNQQANGLTQGHILLGFCSVIATINALLFEFSLQVILHAAHQVRADRGNPRRFHSIEDFLGGAGVGLMTLMIIKVVESQAQGNFICRTPQGRQLLGAQRLLRQRNARPITLNIGFTAAKTHRQLLITRDGTHG